MTDDVTTFEEELELDYEYTVGPLGRQFFEGFRDQGEIRGSRCPECTSVMIPPQPFCTLCFVEVEEDLVPVDNTGTLNMWTEVHIPFPGQGKEPPYIWAFVNMDGADTTFTHILADDVDAEDVEIGMKVEAVWKDPEDRQGELTDIKHFRPVED